MLDSAPAWQCPSCGIAYAKFRGKKKVIWRPRKKIVTKDEEESWKKELETDELKAEKSRSFWTFAWPFLAAFFIGTGEYTTKSYSKIYTQIFYQFDSTTQGKITSSEIVEKGSTLLPRIEYEYLVNGWTYRNDLIRLSDTVNGAHRLTNRYKIGTVVTVFYNRGNPNYAALENDSLNAWVIFQALAGLAMAGLVYSFSRK